VVRCPVPKTVIAGVALVVEALVVLVAMAGAVIAKAQCRTGEARVEVAMASAEGVLVVMASAEAVLVAATVIVAVVEEAILGSAVQWVLAPVVLTVAAVGVAKEALVSVPLIDAGKIMIVQGLVDQPTGRSTRPWTNVHSINYWFGKRYISYVVRGDIAGGSCRSLYMCQVQPL